MINAKEINSVFLYVLVFQVFKPIVEKFNFTFNCDIKKRWVMETCGRGRPYWTSVWAQRHTHKVPSIKLRDEFVIHELICISCPCVYCHHMMNVMWFFPVFFFHCWVFSCCLMFPMDYPWGKRMLNRQYTTELFLRCQLLLVLGS